MYMYMYMYMYKLHECVNELHSASVLNLSNNVLYVPRVTHMLTSGDIFSSVVSVGSNTSFSNAFPITRAICRESEGK